MFYSDLNVTDFKKISDKLYKLHEITNNISAGLLNDSLVSPELIKTLIRNIDIDFKAITGEIDKFSSETDLPGKRESLRKSWESFKQNITAINQFNLNIKPVFESIFKFLLYFSVLVLFFWKDYKDYKKNLRIVELESSARDLEHVSQVIEGLRSTMKSEELLALILKNLITELRFDRAVIYTLADEGKRKILKYTTGYGVKIEDPELLTRPLDKELSILARCALEKTSLLIEDARKNYFCEQNLVKYLDLKEFALVPIIVKEKTKGILFVDNYYNKEKITDSQLLTLSIFANQAGISIESSELYEKIESLAIKDELTGLFNRRYFQDTLNNELLRAERFEHELTMILFDLDNFKHYNDTNGHVAGDELLRQIGRILFEQLRKTDIPCRYGGEEFIIIMPETGLKETQLIAERIRAVIESFPFKFREKQPLKKVSVSIGISMFPEHGTEGQKLVEFADKGLYLAKESGRNRVCIFSGSNQ